MKLFLILSSLFIFLNANEICNPEQSKILSKTSSTREPNINLNTPYECLDKESQTAIMMDKYEDIYNDPNTKKAYVSRFDEMEEEESTDSINDLVSESFIQHLLSQPIVKEKPIIKKKPVLKKKPIIKKKPRKNIYKESLSKRKVSVSSNSIHKDTPYFLAASYSGVIFDIDTNIKNIERSGSSLEVEAGYYISRHTFLTLGYERIMLSDMNINNFSTSINYQFNGIYDFKPFIGLSLGYGYLTWKDTAFDTVGNKNVTASSISTGIKIGIEKALNQSFSYYSIYKFNLTDFQTALRNSTNTSSVNVNHNNYHSFGLGIRYNF